MNIFSDSKPDGEAKSSKTTFEDLLDTLKELEAEPPEVNKQQKSFRDIWGNPCSIFALTFIEIFIKIYFRIQEAVVIMWLMKYDLIVGFLFCVQWL